MLTLHLCAAALTWDDFHIGTFLLSNTMSPNKAASLLAHHIIMLQAQIGKGTCNIFNGLSFLFKNNHREIWSCSCSYFLGNISGEKKNGLLWGFTNPS